MQDSQVVVGVDIGGTNTSVGIMTPIGEILYKDTIPTEAALWNREHLKPLCDIIAHVMDRASVQIATVGGIGVGCTGPIDAVTGRVHNPFTLPTWDDVPLVDLLT